VRAFSSALSIGGQLTTHSALRLRERLLSPTAAAAAIAHTVTTRTTAARVLAGYSAAVTVPEQARFDHCHTLLCGNLLVDVFPVVSTMYRDAHTGRVTEIEVVYVCVCVCV
jgi:acetyl esterase/lipase